MVGDGDEDKVFVDGRASPWSRLHKTSNEAERALHQRKTKLEIHAKVIPGRLGVIK